MRPGRSLRRLLPGLLACLLTATATVTGTGALAAGTTAGVPAQTAIAAGGGSSTPGPATTPIGATTPAQTERPSVLGSAESSEDSGLAVEIEELSPRVLTTQDKVVVSGTISNSTDAELTGPLHLEVHLQSVSALTQDQLTGFLSGSQLAGALVAEGTVETPPAPGDHVTFSLDVATSDLPLGSSFEWGPRGLSVDASAGTASGGDRTILLWDSGYEVSPTRIATLVPWSTTSEADPRAEADTAVDLAGTKGVTLAIDPEVLLGADPDSPDPDQQSGVAQSPLQPTPSPSTEASTGTPSSSAASTTPTPTPSASKEASPSSGGAGPTPSGSSETRSLAHRLLTTAPEVVALPRWDADLAALSMSEASDLLTLASDSRTSSLHEGTAKVIRNVVWPGSGTFGRQALQAFPSDTLIAPPGALAPSGDLSFTSVTRVEVDPTSGTTSVEGPTDTTSTVLTSQASLSDLLSWEPASAADELDTEQVLTALGAVITRELPNQSRTLFAPVARGTVLDDGLTRRLDALVGQRWMDPLPFSEVADSDPTDLERQTVEDAPALEEVTTQALASISQALASTTALAQALSEPQELQDRLDDEALKTLSATGDTEDRSRRLAAFQGLVRSLLTAVRAEPSATINLINKSTNFPVRVTNELPWEVSVVVGLLPSDPRLQVSSTQTTTVAPHSTVSVDVPVTAIGSGDITVRYLVSTPQGQVLDDNQSVTVRMRAGWEDTGTAVVAVLLVVMLVAGVGRTIHRRLRDRSASKEE